DLELAGFEACLWVLDGLPGAEIPEHHRAAAVLTLGNGTLEGRVVEWMILGADGETLVGGGGAGAARHGPAFEHAFIFEAEIVMQPGRIVLLHHEYAARSRARTARGFAGLGEIALGAVFVEQVAGARHLQLAFLRGDDFVDFDAALDFERLPVPSRLDFRASMRSMTLVLLWAAVGSSVSVVIFLRPLDLSFLSTRARKASV